MLIQITNIRDRAGVYFKYKNTDSFLTIECNNTNERALILEALYHYEYRHIGIAKEYITVDLNNDSEEPESCILIGSNYEN